MTDIEFIENEMECCEIDFVLAQKREDKIMTRHLKERYEQLKQIKTILEAWEVVKHTIYKRKMGEESFIQVMGGVYNEGQCGTSGINPYEIIKKALEVEDGK